MGAQADRHHGPHHRYAHRLPDRARKLVQRRRNPELAARVTIERGKDGKPTGWLSGDNRAITDLYDLLPRPTFAQKIRDNLIKGAEGVASEVYYQKRLRNLYELLRGKPGQDGKPSGGLIDLGNDLERKLTQEINR